MRVLLIGGNGFIGKGLALELIESGHQVAIFHRRRDTVENALQIQGDRNRLHEGFGLLQSFAPQLIIDMILSSREQARRLVSVAKNLDARVVAISSMDVYRAWGVMQGTEPGELEPIPLTEESGLRKAGATYPPEVVKAMKGIFTWLTSDYDKVGVEQEVMGTGRHTVIRLPMVYGPGDPLHRFYGLMKRIKDGRPAILLSEDHAAWRGPRGYVENVAHAIALASTSEGALGRTYHICDEPTLPELEWERKIAEQAKWAGNFVLLPRNQTPKHLLTPGNASQHLVADSSRIRRELGYQHRVGMDEAIRRTIAWEEANPPNCAPLHKFDYAAEDAALAAFATSR